MRSSEEVLLKKVGDSNVVNISEALDPEEYIVNELNETENEWKQKRMHGQYVREKEGIDWDRTWQWIVKGELKRCRGPDMQRPGTSFENKLYGFLH